NYTLSLHDALPISNTGTVAGEEAAQLYVGFKNSAIDRPMKLLRGFQKIFLKPSETKTITFEIKTEDLAYYDEGSKSWKVELMPHEVFVGKSSASEDLLKAEFVVE